MLRMMSYMYPTLSLSLEIKKDPKGAKWLYMRSCPRDIVNGRYSIDVQFFDEVGDLIAYSSQICLMIEIKQQPRERIGGRNVKI
jgi:hypothetical protein